MAKDVYKEKEKAYLNDTVRLINDSRAKAIVTTGIAGRFHCLACKSGPGHIQLTSGDSFLTHCAGKKHQTNLARVHDFQFFKKTDKANGAPLSNANTKNAAAPARVDVDQPSTSQQNGSIVAVIEDKVTKFDRKLLIAKVVIDSKYDKYMNDLNSHPRYEEEWLIFWNRRSQEIVAKGMDAVKYDYTSEFLQYFDLRIKELKKMEIEQERAKLLSSFGITEADVKRVTEKNSKEKENDEKKKSGEVPVKRNRTPIPVFRRSSSSSDESSPEAKRQRKHSRDERKHSRHSSRDDPQPSTSKSSHSSRPSTSSSSRGKRSDSPVDRKAQKSNNGEVAKSERDNAAGDKLSARSVFRELAALEPEVGTVFAPKVVDLLMTSIKYEKIDASNCDKIIMNGDNTALIEAISEKLNSQLELKLVARERVAAVQRVVENIRKLMRDLTKTDTDRKRIKSEIMDKMIALLKESIFTHQDLQKMISAIKKHVEQNTHESDGESNDVATQPPIETVDLLDDDEDALDDGNQTNGNNNNNEMKDEELILLMQNIDEIGEAEQEHLLKFLEGLEKNDPERVKRLRKEANLIG